MVSVRGISSRGSAIWQRLRTRSSSNFKFAFLFLSHEQREALEAVYEFCRVVDDIVDERSPGPEGRRQAAAQLEDWRAEIKALFGDDPGPLDGSLSHRLRDAVSRYGLRADPMMEIIEGCAMDLDRDAYSTFEELERYCYRVASCVGLLCVPIFGDDSDAAREYARHLGLALQYTNILRDVGEDAARGRVYLPTELLSGHGLTRADIQAGAYDARFIGAAAQFAAVAEREYQLAWRGFEAVDAPLRLVPAEVMGRTYYEILGEIRRFNFDVFVRRASLRRRQKLRVAAMTLARNAAHQRNFH